ncbi:MAG: hypothetical protein FWG24_00750 [Eggerthellaceae bacterium]|jgi:hypothetical protein|nr:hypothetical protein [Eggerthellaceae bacterium]MDR2722057.1 hypothetical protein [Coriobacteriaceae bacterium]
MENKRHIYILLTKHSDNFSQFIVALIQGHYSHASIAFEEEGHYYSFTRRGFHIEDPEKICRKRHNVQCALYRIPVSCQAYDSMKSHLDSHYMDVADWKYNIVGVFLGMVRFSFLKRKRKRFCSQFVAEILEAGKEVRLQKKSSVVFPDDFAKAGLVEPEFLGTLEGLVKRYRRTKRPQAA